MNEIPLDPPLARTLLWSVKLGCSKEVLVIVAMLSVDRIFYSPYVCSLYSISYFASILC